MTSTPTRPFAAAAGALNTANSHMFSAASKKGVERSASKAASRGGGSVVAAAHAEAYVVKGTQEDVRKLRRELKAARDELHTATVQNQRAQSLVTKYQRTIVGLQAAQSEREAALQSQMKDALESRVEELQVAMQAELEVQLRQQTEQTDREQSKRVRAQRRAEETEAKAETIEGRLREALEQSREELRRKEEEHASGVQRAQAALAEQQAQLEERACRLADRDAELARLRGKQTTATPRDQGAPPPAWVDHPPWPAVRGLSAKAMATSKSAGTTATTTCVDDSQRQLFTAASEETPPSSAGADSSDGDGGSSSFMQALSSLDADMQSLHAEIDVASQRLITVGAGGGAVDAYGYACGG